MEGGRGRGELRREGGEETRGEGEPAWPGGNR